MIFKVVLCLNINYVKLYVFQLGSFKTPSTDCHVNWYPLFVTVEPTPEKSK